MTEETCAVYQTSFYETFVQLDRTPSSSALSGVGASHIIKFNGGCLYVSQNILQIFMIFTPILATNLLPNLHAKFLLGEKLPANYINQNQVFKGGALSS